MKTKENDVILILFLTLNVLVAFHYVLLCKRIRMDSPHFQSKGKAKVLDYPEDTLPWVEKYRPKSLDQLVSHQDIVSTSKFLWLLAKVDKFIRENKLPHLLFYGPPGTGKTSTILACARKLYGDRFKNMILEVFYWRFIPSWMHLMIVVSMSLENK